MTGQSIGTNAAVEVARGAAGILPEEGRIAVLAYLVSEIPSEALKALSPEARRKLLAALGSDSAPRSAFSTEGAASATQSHAAPVQKTPLQVAQDIVDTYSFNQKKRTSTFTIPAGVTDVEAIKTLNEYFRRNHSRFNRDAVYADHLDWFERLPKEFSTYCQPRDYSQARRIPITGVVKGTKGKNRNNQEGVLEDKSLVFPDPRDQALAAAIHACKYNGEDLFKGLSVRGSVPGVVLFTSSRLGVCAFGYFGGTAPSRVAASGTPFLESK